MCVMVTIYNTLTFEYPITLIQYLWYALKCDLPRDSHGLCDVQVRLATKMADAHRLSFGML